MKSSRPNSRHGSLSGRFSIEIRAMARRTAPPQDVDPAIYISWRNGLPTIVKTRNASDGDADEFLASAELARVSDLGKAVG